MLAPDKLVEDIDALVLSGGSAFGLDAASGVTDGLRKLGRGFKVEKATVPIVPGAIIFDLLNEGDKDWDENPYRALGLAALRNARAEFGLGTAGAGVGALTANLKGGLGSASLVIPGGFTVGALVVANPTGSVTMGDSKHFWAAPFEVDGEFGGLGPLPGTLPFAQSARSKRDWVNPIANTTIAIVATDADLSKGAAQASRGGGAGRDRAGGKSGAYAGRRRPDLFGFNRGRGGSTARSPMSCISATRQRCASAARWHGRSTWPRRRPATWCRPGGRGGAGDSI